MYPIDEERVAFQYYNRETGLRQDGGQCTAGAATADADGIQRLPRPYYARRRSRIKPRRSLAVDPGTRTAMVMTEFRPEPTLGIELS